MTQDDRTFSNAIYLISGNELVPLRETPYESEDLLQRLLATHPGLLAGDQMDRARPRRWMLIMREAGIPGAEKAGDRWSVDHLFLDQDAVPTLVEVKRSSDTRIRREVVGQMLDYAANAVVYWPADHLRLRFEARCEQKGLDPAVYLLDTLGRDDVDAFWDEAKRNLQSGRVRMLFVADEIPTELRRIIEFLNEQMDPAEVLGVEIRQFAGANLQTLVPKVIGQTVEAEQRKTTAPRPARQWDETSFFDDLSVRHNPETVDAVREVLGWAKRHASRIWWGRGALHGSFIPVIAHGGEDFQLFAVYATGTFEIHFQYLRARAPFDDRSKRLELLGRLNSLDGVSIGEERIEKRPSIRLELLTRSDNLRRLLATYEWVIDEIRSA